MAALPIRSASVDFIVAPGTWNLAGSVIYEGAFRLG
jgi:hypothetical protein